MLSRKKIDEMGFMSVGEGVQISDRASFYGAENITIGSHVRIDDYSVISAGRGGIAIGNYIHIAVYSSLIGKERIALADFCNISARVSIYSSSDDYSGKTLTNPTVLDDFKRVTHAPVILGKHVIIGCGTVIMPGLSIGDGAAIGALTFVTRDCDPFSIYAGVPAKKIRDRNRDLLDQEKLFLLSRNPDSKT